jgi:hypothetical protein
VLLVARCGVLGLEVLTADAAGDRARGVLLGADPKWPGWLAAAGDLEPLAGLADRLLPVAVLTGPSALLPVPWPPSSARRRKVSR